MLIRYWPDRTKIPFMSLRVAGALFSMVLIAASAFLLGTRGLNFGVDFAGGTVMELAKTDTVTVLHTVVTKCVSNLIRTIIQLAK